MNRRDFLILVGTATALAGCKGSGDNREHTQSSKNGSRPAFNSATSKPEPTETPKKVMGIEVSVENSKTPERYYLDDNFGSGSRLYSDREDKVEYATQNFVNFTTGKHVVALITPNDDKNIQNELLVNIIVDSSKWDVFVMYDPRGINNLPDWLSKDFYPSGYEFFTTDDEMPQRVLFAYTGQKESIDIGGNWSGVGIETSRLDEGIYAKSNYTLLFVSKNEE